MKYIQVITFLKKGYLFLKHFFKIVKKLYICFVK